MKKTDFLKKTWSIFCVFMMMIPCVSAEGEEDMSHIGDLISERIPDEYLSAPVQGGTVERIEYPSKDYSGDGAEVMKPALVYLPPDYSEENAYDLLVLCHGIGGSELEWGFGNANSAGRNAIDRMILNGEIQPLIIVMPNGRSTVNYTDASFGNMNSFYSFGQEIRNDLIPYMDTHYATRASKRPDDPEYARLTRSMAGLSMGGMQTINIGLCECLDLFSAFGAFSAAPTSYPAAQLVQKLNAFPNEKIRFFYNICGTNDSIAYASASGAAKNLPTYSERFDENNFLWQELPGDHNFTIWNLGLYNFVRILNAVRVE